MVRHILRNAIDDLIFMVIIIPLAALVGIILCLFKILLPRERFRQLISEVHFLFGERGKSP